MMYRPVSTFDLPTAVTNQFEHFGQSPLSNVDPRGHLNKAEKHSFQVQSHLSELLQLMFADQN